MNRLLTRLIDMLQSQRDAAKEILFRQLNEAGRSFLMNNERYDHDLIDVDQMWWYEENLDEDDTSASSVDSDDDSDMSDDDDDMRAIEHYKQEAVKNVWVKQLLDKVMLWQYGDPNLRSIAIWLHGFRQEYAIIDPPLSMQETSYVLNPVSLSDDLEVILEEYEMRCRGLCLECCRTGEPLAWFWECEH